jgi:hypothetical protein
MNLSETWVENPVLLGRLYYQPTQRLRYGDRGTGDEAHRESLTKGSRYAHLHTIQFPQKIHLDVEPQFLSPQSPEQVVSVSVPEG